MSIVAPPAVTHKSSPFGSLSEQGSSVAPDFDGGGELEGVDPKELHEAYGVPETGGSEETLAIVDPYNDPNAQSDLDIYRERYKLYYKGTETACTEANGCFKKVDQEGETEKEAKERSKAFPEANETWGIEISLDIEMASAMCPECKILLVEADEDKIGYTGPAEDEAAALKATEISNSWGALRGSRRDLGR